VRALEGTRRGLARRDSADGARPAGADASAPETRDEENVIQAEPIQPAPAAVCGASKVAQSLGFAPERIGCGKRVETCEEVYRCTDCRVPFHRECAVRHFGDAHAPGPPPPATRSDEARASEFLDRPRPGSEERRTLTRAFREARVQGAHEAFAEVDVFLRALSRVAKEAGETAGMKLCDDLAKEIAKLRATFA
jgi:hypothetical protein